MQAHSAVNSFPYAETKTLSASCILCAPDVGSPTAALTMGCRLALADLFASKDCSSSEIVACTTQSATILQWRLLCMSGVLKAHASSMFSAQGPHSEYVDWSTVHPAATTYLDLWAGPSKSQFGPVAVEVLRQQQQTKLMVLELAQALYIKHDLQASSQGRHGSEASAIACKAPLLGSVQGAARKAWAVLGKMFCSRSS